MMLASIASLRIGNGFGGLQLAAAADGTHLKLRRALATEGGTPLLAAAVWGPVPAGARTMWMPSGTRCLHCVDDPLRGIFTQNSLGGKPPSPPKRLRYSQIRAKTCPNHLHCIDARPQTQKIVGALVGAQRSCFHRSTPGATGPAAGLMMAVRVTVPVSSSPGSVTLRYCTSPACARVGSYPVPSRGEPLQLMRCGGYGKCAPRRKRFHDAAQVGNQLLYTTGGPQILCRGQ
jgi:hypothetical protein